MMRYVQVRKVVADSQIILGHTFQKVPPKPRWMSVGKRVVIVIAIRHAVRQFLLNLCNRLRGDMRATIYKYQLWIKLNCHINQIGI